MRGQGRVVTGPMAAQLAGRIYRRLDDENYFDKRSTLEKPNLSATASHYIP